MSTGEVKRRNRPNRYPDDLLLGAAAEVFHERGFRQASMNEIAARAGVTKPTLYARYGNKERLYDRALERSAASLVSELRAAYEGLGDATPEEATVGPARTFFEWVRAHPVEFSLLFTDDNGAPTGVDHRERAIEMLTEVVDWAGSEYLRERGIPPAEFSALIAACVVGVFQFGAGWALRHDQFGSFDVGALVSQFVLRGLDGVSPEPLADLARRTRARTP